MTAVARLVPEGAARHDEVRRSVEGLRDLQQRIRRRKLAEDERQLGLGWLRGLRMRIDQEMSALAFSRLSELAAAHQLSVYDAAYLELAARRRLVLGCKDGPLRRAAKHVSVGLWA